MALYDSHDAATDSTSVYVGDAGNDWTFQTFTPTYTYKVSSIAVNMYKAATGTMGTITIAIYAVDGANKPTGAILASGTTPGDTFTSVATGEWRTVTLSAVYQLTAGTKYAIVASAPGCDAGKNMTWLATTGDVYAGYGGYSDDGGPAGTWSLYAQTDMHFRTYGVPVAAAPSSDKRTLKRLITVASNELWYNEVETPTLLADSVGQLDTTLPITICEAYGKVFIANGANLKVADFTNSKIATADLGANPPDFGTILTGGTSGAKMVVDYITALTGATTVYGKRTTTATFSTGEVVTGTDDDGNAISFTMTAVDEVAAPHWYDWTVFGNSATFGVMPNKADDVKNYRGRLCLSCDREYPHQWYQSKQRNPWNWLYGSNNAQSAIRGGNSDAGEIGDVVLTQIPYKDDYMIFGCESTLWFLAGDAAEGGSINELDLTTGIVGQQAYCWDNEDNLYILASKGLLRIPNGFGSPQNLTQESYPDFIEDLAFNPSTHRLTMGYDRIRHGIVIAKTTLADGTHEGWWYSLRTEGLFPETYPEECGPFSMFWYEASDPAFRELLLGCNDGYIRHFDNTSVDDNIGATDEAINSYVTLGPIKLGSENREGKIYSMVGTTTGGLSGGTETDSNDVDYKIFLGRTADNILEKLSADSAPVVTGTIPAPGRPLGSYKKQKLRAAWAGIRLENETVSETWGLDSITLGVKDAGRMK